MATKVRNETHIVVNFGNSHCSDYQEYEHFRVGGKSYMMHVEDGHHPELHLLTKTKKTVHFREDGPDAPAWDVYRFSRAKANTLDVLTALRLTCPNHVRAAKSAA